jgi:conjugative relaxase-like TrwC/TraI family protein
MSVTISKALSAAGAVKYFKDEYEHARGSYYSEDERILGQWSGQLAEHFGLKGAVNRDDFEKLCEGQDLRDAAQLVRHVKAHQRTNQYGDEIETSGHRAGFDITLSAPKSISLAAIVGGDERIRGAHAEAVSLTLEELEKFAQARLGGSQPAQTTGKLLFASFQHDASRPDRKGGYAAPNLHTHNFAFNLTQANDGQIKSLQPREIYKCQQYGKALYRAKLAENLQKLGYEIQVDKRTGAPEIAGISREYIDASSPRQREIKEAQQALGVNSTRVIAARNRRTKVYDREEMKERHRELDRQHGGQAHAVVTDARAQAQEMSALLWDERSSKTKAQESVTFAIQRGSEREAITDMRQLMTDALRRNLGQTTVETIKAEMQARQDKGQLVGLVLDDQTKQRMTTQKMLEMESGNIEKVKAGQNTQQPITERIEENLTTSQGVNLSESQRTAVKQIVTSRDQIIGLQGGAGTGKTTALEAVREAAERAGYDVQGFAPTTRATQLLAESGMQSRTLQKFLRQKAEPDAPKRFYVLDESSLASTKAVNSFLSRVRPQDRVLLVGDVKQHEAVEAGSPFAQLQRHGMETAKLEKIVRQKDAPLREVVENLAVGKIKEAVEGLRGQGRITEITDTNERLKTIAKDYCEQPESTLVISPANRERVELNQLIHQQLQNSGQISKRDYHTKVLENRNDMTGAERTFAAAYQPNDIIRYTSASKNHSISAGEYARVLSTNEKDNTITVKLEKSQREVSYNPQRLKGVSVYREAERQFATGDRLQFRAPYHPERVANGELGTLEKIERGKLTVALDSGRKVDFDIEKNRHIDHGYAVTSHSSQGQTIDRVLINADTHESDKLLNQRMSYVAGSRARLDARIYTDSEERLSAALARQVDKSTALEASRETHETKARNVARLVPIEKAMPTLQPTQERPENRPPAQRAPQPAQSELVRQPAEPSPLAKELGQMQQQMIEQRANQEPLPVPDSSRARYVTIMPVDGDRPAASMSKEFVQLANSNHLANTGQEISPQVQRFMQANLIKAAERPPSPEQLHGITDACQKLGISDDSSQITNALQASLWRAHNSPDRTDLLENFTKATETAFAQTQAQTIDISIDNTRLSDSDIGISR